MQPDHELLRQYAQTGSEVAFAELVRRHVNLVYSAALRQVGGDAHLAHDAAQSVFTDLARKAASLCRRESLTGWLYTSAHFAASKLVRAEHRRRQREEQFMSDPAHLPATELDWETLRPILDSAMHGLQETDREAVLLRYFENRPYAEVGAKLGLNENAARMRVERALEKLRALLAKRALITTAGLASVISTNAVQLAPANAITTLTTASLAAAKTGTSLALLKIMTAVKLKIALGALAIAGAATVFIVQHHADKRLNTENEQLRQQVKRLQDDAETFSNRLAATSDSKSLTEEQLAELLKLRGEVAGLRSRVADAEKVLAQRAAQSAAQSNTNDPKAQETAQQGRRLGAAHDLAFALYHYTDRHKGQFPTNWDQLKEDFRTAELTGLAPGQVAPDSETEFAWATNEYEFVYHGSMKDLEAATNFNDLIVFRQKQPWWRSSDGKWVKTYGFADGHGLLRADPPEGFDQFEKERMAPPPNQ